MEDKIDKYILTGGPGSGKSSILLALEQRGEAIIREAAEDVIKLEQSRGNKEPWLDIKYLQNKILALQLKREALADKIAKNDRVFIDRGVIDGLAYCQIQDKIMTLYMRDTIDDYKIIPFEKPKSHQYTKIFLIENLGRCDKTDVRREELGEALKLEGLQEENYKRLGYEVVRIAPNPLELRVDYVLNSI